MSGAPVIELRDVRFRWTPDGPWVLDVPEFVVPRGEHVFLAGPSGSGKSSLLSLIAGVATPQSGHVRVLDTVPADLGGARRDRFRADHLGVVFQLFNLLPYLSVLENVTLACRFSPRRRANAARAGGVDSEARRLLRELELGDAALHARRATALSVGPAAARRGGARAHRRAGTRHRRRADLGARHRAARHVRRPADRASAPPRARPCSSSATTAGWRSAFRAGCRFPTSTARAPRHAEARAGRACSTGASPRGCWWRRSRCRWRCSPASSASAPRPRRASRRAVAGTDLVVGARSGPVNLMLYSVFRIGDATNNISWKSYEAIARQSARGVDRAAVARRLAPRLSRARHDARVLRALPHRHRPSARASARADRSATSSTR